MAESIRAFVVFDSGASRSEIERALSGGGIEIVAVADGFDEARARVPNDADDVLVVAVAGQSEPALRFIEVATREQPARPVVVIGRDLTDEFTRQVFAAGIDDMLVLPFAPDEALFTLQKAVARKAAVTEAGGFSEAPLICVFGPKGGTGKTVTATSVAVALAELGRSVALVDIDLQFGDVGLCLGVVPETTIFDLVQAGGSLDEEKVNGFMPTHSSGVRLLLAPRHPDQANVVSVEFLHSVYATLRRMVEYVIVDTPPGFTAEVIATIDDATTVCAVGTLDLLSLKDTGLGLDALDLMGFPLDHIKLILNRAGSLVGISDEQVRSHWRREPDICVPSDRDIVRAVNAGVSILVTKPRSEASEAFRMLARQLSESDGFVAPEIARAGLWRRNNPALPSRPVM
jgi:pilus assembly protein CpaE